MIEPIILAPESTLYVGDCVDVMRQRIADGTIDLTVTSPPYDELRKYNGYSFDFESVAQELWRVTKSGGVVVWVVTDGTVKGTETGTSFRQASYFMSLGFNLHDTMIWHKPNPVPTQHTRYESSFEYMFVFSKGKPSTTHILREPAKDGGVKRTKHRSSGGSSHSNNDEGIYVTKDDKIRHNVWEIPTQSTKTGHPAVFPERIPEDHILSWSNPGDLVFDPFLGSGTTGKMAIKNRRRFVGCDMSEDYVLNIAKPRIESVLSDNHA